MYTIQLNPSIPMDTCKGPGLAILMTFLSEEHSMLWTIAIDGTGELWTLDNKYCRLQKNIQMERIIDNKNLIGDLKGGLK